MTMLRFEKLKKHYGGVQVLHEVSFDIDAGEFVVVVGPSGCGKSTFLRMLAGLETVTSGEILLDGECINRVLPAERNMAMVFQNYALYPHMSVYQNMAYGLKMRGKKRREIKKRVQQAAEMLGLSHLLARKPKALSGGQRQRVAMGRAIVRQPKVFLFDEPLSNLDAKLRVEMRLKIHKLQRELGITSIYVTHDQIEAMTLADKLVVMNNGYVEQIGSPLEVYHNPSSQFVAAFIGSPSMNFFPAKLEKDKVHIKGQSAWEPPEKWRSLSEPTINIGARPDALSLVEGAGEWVMRGRLEMIESLGNEFILFVRVPGVAAEVLARTYELPSAKEGDEVFVKLNPEKLYCFSEASGKRAL